MGPSKFSTLVSSSPCFCYSGRNGKSLIRDPLAAAFGDTATGYFGVVAASLLTKERPSSDRPVVDLLHMKGKRLLIASEPEKGFKVNCGFLKFLTGNDPINGRWLQSNAEISFYPQYSLALLCNSIPNLDANDEAVWDRSRVLSFPFKFVKKPTLEHHRKGDPYLKSTLPGLGPHLMSILLEYYVKFRRNGLEPTPEMMSNTRDVRVENDVYGEFIDEYLVVTDDDLDRLAWNQIVQKCQDWMKEHPVYRMMKFDSKELKEAVTGRNPRWETLWTKP
jgi:putative DNA primase/helicase